MNYLMINLLYLRFFLTDLSITNAAILVILLLAILLIVGLIAAIAFSSLDHQSSHKNEISSIGAEARHTIDNISEDYLKKVHELINGSKGDNYDKQK